MTDYALVQATFTRPADTTAYASGDLVANSTTAGSVAMMTFTPSQLNSRRSGKIKGARLQKSAASVTNASFRLHLFAATKTFTNGDNGAIVANSSAGYIGAIDIDLSSGSSAVFGTPVTKDSASVDLPFRVNSNAIYGVLEARGAYTPASGEVFVADLRIEF